MMKKNTKLTKNMNRFRNQLTAILFAVGIFPLILIGVFSHSTIDKMLKDNLEDSIDQTVARVESIFNEYFLKLEAFTNMSTHLGGFQAIVDIENRPGFLNNAQRSDYRLETKNKWEQREIELMTSFLKEMEKDEDILIGYFATINKNIYASDEQYIYGVDGTFDVSSRQWFKQSIENIQKANWSDAYADRSTDHQVISLSKAVLGKQGRPLGVFSLDITAKQLMNKIYPLDLSYEGSLRIIDKGGHYIVHENPEKLGTPAEIDFEESLVLKEFGEYESEDNLLKYTKNKATGWTMIFSFPKKVLYSMGNEIGLILLLIGLIVSLTVGLIAFRIAHRISLPLEEILKHMDHLKKGRFSTRLPNYLLNKKDDLGTLAQSIDIMQSEVGATMESMRKLNLDMYITQKDLVYQLGEISESRSLETGHHVKRVAGYSYVLGKKYGLSEKECDTLKLASTLHDIGKLAIPDDILLKPGSLTPQEFETVKTHTILGHGMLEHSKQEILKEAAVICRSHHEKFNGSGYPDNLKGNEIPLNARIVALADVFDALCVDRVYKKAWPIGETLAYIEAERGRHFDPKIVDIFFENLDEIIQIRQKYQENHLYIVPKNEKLVT